MKGAFDKLAEIRPMLAQVPEQTTLGDEFLNADNLVSVQGQVAENRLRAAMAVLTACNERDRRSRHKGLVRLCKIEYLLGRYADVVVHAAAADRFFRQQWTNACADALFWRSLGALRAGDLPQASRAAEELQTFQPDYPKLGRLLAAIAGREEAHGAHS